MLSPRAPAGVARGAHAPDGGRLVDAGDRARVHRPPRRRSNNVWSARRRRSATPAIPYRVPPRELLPERFDGVLAVLYLIFNEGYSATEGPLVRVELCDEAIWLARVLSTLMPDAPEALGLLALMLLAALPAPRPGGRRGRARPAGGSGPLPLGSRLIDEGLETLDRAMALGAPGPYQVQAAIAALHARAPRAEDTDWPQIATLYRGWPSRPLARRVSSTARSRSRWPTDPTRDSRSRTALADELDAYYLFHSARADLLRRLGRSEEAVRRVRTSARVDDEPARTGIPRASSSRRLTAALELPFDALPHGRFRRLLLPWSSWATGC